MSQAREDHHFLSLLKPVFREQAHSLIFRPYQGSTAAWGKVTFREYEAHLSVVMRQRSQQWSNLGMKNGDVVGVWCDPIFCNKFIRLHANIISNYHLGLLAASTRILSMSLAYVLRATFLSCSARTSQIHQ
jgi:hypothetical protein